MTVPRRQCDGCTLCCKVFSIAALNKPMGQWCTHCAIGTGCTIYKTRPEACRTFNCAWLMNAWMDDSWKPSISGMVLHTDPPQKRVIVRVDPATPDAWTREPYHAQLRKWAQEWAPSGSSIMVLVEEETWIVLPDRDVAFGKLAGDETIVFRRLQTPTGLRYDAIKVRRNAR